MKLGNMVRTGLVAAGLLAGAASNAFAQAGDTIKVGIAKLAQGSLAEAERSFNEALQKDPKNSLAYYNLGILRLRQGLQRGRPCHRVCRQRDPQPVDRGAAHRLQHVDRGRRALRHGGAR